MNRDLRSRIEFFAENAGYATPPGRMACAKSLALAEIAAERRCWAYEWEEDWDADTSWLEDERESYKERSRFYSCILRDVCGEVLASLGGIHFLGEPDFRRDSYVRVVEAELAAEAKAREDGRQP